MVFRKREDAEKHLTAGAKKVVISAPGSGEMFTVVLGVNDGDYDSAKHHIISNASCTTNCLAPLVKVLDQNFGLETGLMTTIHAVTNDQRMLDMWHKDLRRARAGVGRLNGMAIRVPLVDVSLVDLVAVVEKEVTVDVVNEAFKKASEKGDMAPYLGYVDEPLVSSDFINDTDSSCSFDSLATMTQGNMVKVLGWYDNEAGYAHRLADLAALIAKKL
jgi:glyceraldehyde 3-phosphate dehydrogenase